jgi:hypothetical protein
MALFQLFYRQSLIPNQFIYLKFNLAGPELWQLVAANPRLRQLHLNQSMGTSVGEFLCREQARFWGNFPKVEADREPVHVYCRELDLDDEIGEAILNYLFF